MKKILLLLSILTASIFAYANTEKAPGVFKEVIVTGYGDSADSAKTNACRKAVKMVVGEYLDVATEAKNDDFAESIIALSAGYIESTKELAPPTKNADGIWSVKISALVKVEKVRERVARFRTSENLVDFSKFKSKKERENAVIAYVVRYMIDFLKLVNINAELEPDEKKGEVKLKYSTHVHPRAFMNTYKAYVKGLRAAGLEERVGYEGAIIIELRSGAIGFDMPGIPDYEFDEKIQKAMKENEFFVKTEFLDAEGEVLQEYNEPLGNVMNLFTVILHKNLSLKALTTQNSGFIYSAKFDVPEDIKNIKSIRHTIIVKKNK